MKRIYVSLCFISTLLLTPPLLAQIDIDLTTVQGVGIARDTIQLNNIRVDVTTENPKDIAHPKIDTVYYNITFRLDPTTLHLVPLIPCANSQIQVIDSKAIFPIAYAQVTLEQGGKKTTIVTNDKGEGFFNELLSGTALVSVSKEHYLFLQKNIELVCGNNTISLPLQLGNQTRIILNWGNVPRDLDAHLTGPNPGAQASYNNEEGRFHIYFSNKQALNNTVVLQTDDFDSSKPETIAISPPLGTNRLVPGIYRFTVHNFSQEGNITNPGVIVKLEINGQEQIFTPDKSKENSIDKHPNTWVVFELLVTEDGNISTIPIQQFQSLDTPNAIV